MTSRSYSSEQDNTVNDMTIENSFRPGFTDYAERLNGRLAMIGFVSLLAIQVSVKHGLVNWFNCQ